MRVRLEKKKNQTIIFCFSDGSPLRFKHKVLTMTYKASQDLTSGYVSDPHPSPPNFSPTVLPHSSQTSLFLFPRTPSFFIPSYMHFPPAPALSWLDSIANSTEQTLGDSGEQRCQVSCSPWLIDWKTTTSSFPGWSCDKIFHSIWEAIDKY